MRSRPQRLLITFPLIAYNPVVMKNFNSFAQYIKLSLLIILGMFLVVSCSNETMNVRVETTTATVDTTNQPPATSMPEVTLPDDTVYPGVLAPTVVPGYPVATSLPEGLMDEPPNPNIDFPTVTASRGTAGGVLVREITDQGYLPVQPVELVLGAYLDNSRGEPALIRYNDDSPRAQLFNTGVFMFTDIEPGTYALIINLGFTQFVIQNDQGYDYTVEIEAGKAKDLGQVFVSVPVE